MQEETQQKHSNAKNQAFLWYQKELQALYNRSAIPNFNIKPIHHISRQLNAVNVIRTSNNKQQLTWLAK